MKETMTIGTYEAPKVEVIEVEVEKGFASSSGDFGLGGVENENWD